jgi:hypothetical protein
MKEFAKSNSTKTRPKLEDANKNGKVFTGTKYKDMDSYTKNLKLS